jgi:hypothetical protein
MREPEDKALNAPDHGKVTPSQAHPQLGYEASDVNTRGVLIFLISLAAFIVVFFVFVFGMGKVINTELVKHDGPANKWNAALAAPHKMGKSMQSATAMEQQQLQAMTQRFPTPRLQMDDGNQDLVDMHQREDLLLDHYTWVDKQQGVVRIPIDRAMELIVEKGLPVAPGTSATAEESAMDAAKITAPLTNGFARTTYEQEEQTEQSIQHKPDNETSSNKVLPSTKTVAKNESKAQAGGVQ